MILAMLLKTAHNTVRKMREIVMKKSFIKNVSSKILLLVLFFVIIWNIGSVLAVNNRVDTGLDGLTYIVKNSHDIGEEYISIIENTKIIFNTAKKLYFHNSMLILFVFVVYVIKSRRTTKNREEPKWSESE